MRQGDDIHFRRRLQKLSKTPLEKKLKETKEFPYCKGLYPDCPDIPSKENPICKNCPVLEEMLERNNF